MGNTARRTALRTLLVALTVMVTLGAWIGPAQADQTISSTGPLTNITVTSDLNCAVDHAGDTLGEFFEDTACATEIAVGGTVYGPADIPAGNSPTPFTAVSQSGVTGSGTAADPFTVVTVVDVGTTGLRITETDSYVVGQESYRTDVQVANTGGAAQPVILYRAGDCYLQNSDNGFGRVDPSPGGTAVACVAVADPNADPKTPGTRIEQWLPITPGSHYFHAFYRDVWNRVDAGQPFPDTCRCDDYIDNGAGLSWDLSVPAGGSTTVTHLTTFSPTGNLPLTMTKAADQATVSPGATDGYTITLSNSTAAAVTVNSITDTLPAGFAYVAGSSTGATTADPTVSGQTLTWAGPIAVPAATAAGAGTATLHFQVTAASTPGNYTNRATAEAGAVTVVPTGDTAPVTVSGGGGTTTTTTVVGGTTTTTAGTGGTTTTVVGGTTTTTAHGGTTTTSAARATTTTTSGFATQTGTGGTGGGSSIPLTRTGGDFGRLLRVALLSLLVGGMLVLTSAKWGVRPRKKGWR